MPIRTHGSSIKVETNVQGQIVDNDEFVATKSAAEHNPKPSEPWHKGFAEAEALREKVASLYEEQANKIEPDPQLNAAHNNDLKIRNLDR